MQSKMAHGFVGKNSQGPQVNISHAQWGYQAQGKDQVNNSH